jgi:hypothetical protein
LLILFQQFIITGHVSFRFATTGNLPQRRIVKTVHCSQIRLKFGRRIFPGWRAAHTQGVKRDLLEGSLRSAGVIGQALI